MSSYDVAVIGGEIVGLATAHEILSRSPDCHLVLLEKEADWARHQTGRNSGVIHSGIYYTPGSLKAELCRAGAASVVRFAQHHQIDYEVCGKLIVATDDDELPRLRALEERGRLNGIPVDWLSGAEAREFEPHITAVAALRVHTTGIIDYVGVSRTLAELASADGADLRLRTEVVGIQRTTSTAPLHRLITADGEEISARHVVTCGGLQSDRLAHLDGLV